MNYLSGFVNWPAWFLGIALSRSTKKTPAALFRKAGKNGAERTVEIEDFATFPGRLMGVRMRGWSMM